MQPINYMLDVAQPVQMALAGYSQGQGLRAQQQGMEQQRRMMEMQEMQFQQQQQALQQQQARAQEVQAKLAEWATAVENGTATAEMAANLAIEVPEIVEPIQASWGMLSETQKAAKIDESTRFLLALDKNPEAAMAMIDERIAAAENAGDTQLVDVLKSNKIQAEMNPAYTKAALLAELNMNMDPKRFEQFMSFYSPPAQAAASPAGKILSDYEAGKFGPVGSPEAMQIRDQQLERTGAGTTVNVPVSLGDQLSPGFKKQDELFAQIAVDWKTGGGTDAIKQVSQLADVIDRIDAGEAVSGGIQGVTPDIVRAFTNPGALDAQETVEEVVQRNLRVILGAQFTAKEGEQLIRRAFNPRLQPEINRRRLQRLFTQMEIAAQQKQEMVNYFDQNGTLRGYSGRQPNISDFYNALDTEEAGGTQGGQAAPASTLPTIANPADFEALPSGAQFIGPDGKTYRKP